MASASRWIFVRRHVVQRRGAGYQVGEQLGAQVMAPEAHGIRRDVTPDAVPDTQFPLDHEMHDVMRQPGPGRSAVQPVHHPIVPFHQRVGALVVG